jgi:hypothetical protein
MLRNPAAVVLMLALIDRASDYERAHAPVVDP